MSASDEVSEALVTYIVGVLVGFGIGIAVAMVAHEWKYEGDCSHECRVVGAIKHHWHEDTGCVCASGFRKVSAATLKAEKKRGVQP